LINEAKFFKQNGLDKKLPSTVKSSDKVYYKFWQMPAASWSWNCIKEGKTIAAAMKYLKANQFKIKSPTSTLSAISITSLVLVIIAFIYFTINRCISHRTLAKILKPANPYVNVMLTAIFITVLVHLSER